MFVRAASTISHQPTFRAKGFSSVLKELTEPSELIHPDYSEFIAPAFRRRMSDVLKMGVACASDCLTQAGLTQPGAIIVGTSMGCCIHTRNFMDKILASNGGLISPTSFIQSTHNTIAGQISLLLGNHNHNMTHTQNSLSFEHALIDAQMGISEGQNDILVGGADESEVLLYNMGERLGLSEIPPVCGASFFIVSDRNSKSDEVSLMDVGSYGLNTDFIDTINSFLDASGVLASSIDLVLYSSSNDQTQSGLASIFGRAKLFNFQKMSGIYFTNSAFALHYGIDILQQGAHRVSGKQVNRILVCNNLIPENIGFVLLNANTK